MLSSFIINLFQIYLYFFSQNFDGYFFIQKTCIIKETGYIFTHFPQFSQQQKFGEGRRSSKYFGENTSFDPENSD